MRFMELAGWHASDTGKREQAVEMVVAGTLGPSVRASIAAARLAAQAVRPSLPSELYEQVNALHWRGPGKGWRPHPYPIPLGGRRRHPPAGRLLPGPTCPPPAPGLFRLGAWPSTPPH